MTLMSRNLIVHGVERVELLDRHLVEGPIHGDASVVHQHIQPAQKRRCFVGHRPEWRDLIEVGPECRGLASGVHDLLGHGFGARGAVRIVRRHACSLPGERATPRPMPVPAPVTRTRLPSRSLELMCDPSCGKRNLPGRASTAAPRRRAEAPDAGPAAVQACHVHCSFCTPRNCFTSSAERARA